MSDPWDSTDLDGKAVIDPANIDTLDSLEQSVYIDKAAHKSDPYRYSALTSKALQYVQTLSGKEWSDFNRHDPGVTVLEQYCYGLTDLTYRANQPIENLLADPDGVTQYHAHGLYAPSEIYPSAAVTDSDFKRLFLDRLSDIEDIHFKPVNQSSADDAGAYTGLYRVHVKLTRQAMVAGLENQNLRMSDKIRQLFCQHRLLGEDIESIHYVEGIACEVVADVEVSESVVPSDLLAELYHQCAKVISPRAQFSDYQQKISAGMPLHKVFEGPAIYQGFLDVQGPSNDGPSTDGQVVDITTLTQVIQAISGVVSVEDISLVVDGQHYHDSVQLQDDGKTLYLKIPKDIALMRVTLKRNGKKIPFLMDNFKHRISSLRENNEHSGGGSYQYHRLVKRPQGLGLAHTAYHSIQHQFPNTYRLSDVSTGELGQRTRDEVRQFRTYLMFFDQIMANGIEHVQSIDQLLSINNNDRKQLGASFLDRTIINDVEMIYDFPESIAEKKINQITGYYEQTLQKRHQALDFLLAANGEQYAEESLRRFNYFYNAQEIEHELLRQKQRLLKNIVALNRDRGLGFNYLEKSLNTENTSGLHAQVSHRLGIRQVESRTLTVNFVRLGLKLVSDSSYRATSLDRTEPRFVQLDDIEQFKKLDFQIVSRELAQQSARKLGDLLPLVKDLLPFRHNQLSEKIFREGYELARYRIGSITSGADYQLAFQPLDDSPPYYLGSFPSLEQGIQSANALQKIILWLNRDSEGLHVVEHLLLRQAESLRFNGLSVDIPKEVFFYQQVTVVLPNWTVRFNDPEFKAYCEDSIISHCPAHILPNIYWVGYEVMFHFEVLHREWASLLKDPLSETKDRIESSKALADFMLLLFISDQLTHGLSWLGGRS